MWEAVLSREAVDCEVTWCVLVFVVRLRLLIPRVILFLLRLRFLK